MDPKVYEIPTETTTEEVLIAFGEKIPAQTPESEETTVVPFQDEIAEPRIVLPEITDKPSPETDLEGKLFETTPSVKDAENELFDTTIMPDLSTEKSVECNVKCTRI